MQTGDHVFSTASKVGSSGLNNFRKGIRIDQTRSTGYRPRCLALTIGFISFTLSLPVLTHEYKCLHTWHYE